MWRGAAIAGCALLCSALLGACNVVLTKAPLFTQADAAGAPTLRTGVWLFLKQADCDVDPSKPYRDWPDCAGGGFVKEGEISGHKSGAPKDELERTPVVLAAGDPRVAQLRIDVDVSADAQASASGGATASASASGGGHSQPYGYAGVQPTKLDDQGRIVAFRFWPVACGPPPKDKNGADTAAGTLRPLPGMEMTPGDPVCSTTSKAALRAAAKASEAWADGPIPEARWIRDGDR
jgi:hypothetical protein